MSYGLELLAQQETSPTAPLFSLEWWKMLVDVLGTFVTAAAVVIGGLWAYFKFWKDRTYRPRLEVNITGVWVDLNGTSGLHVVVTVKNIGRSVVYLQQEGTWLDIYPMLPPTPPQATADWGNYDRLTLLYDHEWIEPGETVADDLIAAVPRGELPTLVEARLIWRWRGSDNEKVKDKVKGDAKGKDQVAAAATTTVATTSTAEATVKNNKKGKHDIEVDAHIIVFPTDTADKEASKGKENEDGIRQRVWKRLRHARRFQQWADTSGA